MTYPTARYTGVGGEASARLRSADSEPDLVRSSGTRVHYLATGDSTDGLFGLYRWSMGPGRGGAEPHFHRTMWESFYSSPGPSGCSTGPTGWTRRSVTSCTCRPEGCTPSATSPALRRRC